MVRLIPENIASENWGWNTKAVADAVGLLVSVSALVVLCAKHHRSRRSKEEEYESRAIRGVKYASKSPLASPRRLLRTISDKALPPFMISKKKDNNSDVNGAEIEDKGEMVGFGEDGLWQKAILMGEKCRPPEFSGVIHYDNYGNQLHELPPRSPRSSPLANFTFQVIKNEN